MDQRRSKGTGSIRQRPNGRWEARYGFTDDFHKRVQKSVHGKTKAEAAKKLKALIYEIDRMQDLCGPQYGLTFGDWLDIWLREYKCNSIRPTTFDGYQRNIKCHIKPALGEFDLLKLQNKHIQHLLNKLTMEGLSPWAVIKVKNIINGALKQAVRCKHIPFNPTSGVQLPPIRESEIRVFSRDEQTAFLAAAKGERLEALLFCALATGMRKGEIIALTWDCVDFEAREIWVKYTVSYIYNEESKDKGMVCTFPKTKAGRRKIPMGDSLVCMLQQHKVRQTNEILSTGEKWQDLGLVFPSACGTHLRGYRLRKMLISVLERAGLEHMTFHGLRHTAATRMLEQGMALRIVQTIMGHADVTVTMNTYMHVLEDTVRYEMQKMEPIFAHKNEVLALNAEKPVSVQADNSSAFIGRGGRSYFNSDLV